MISKIRGRGHHKIVIKEAFGVAGSNALRLFEPEILPAQLRWLENHFAQKRELIIEPWLERERARVRSLIDEEGGPDDSGG